MDVWQSLLGTALIGTARQTPGPPEVKDALSAVIAQLDWSQPEQALLGAAGAIALHQQVGRRPVKQALSSVAPASLDDLPCCSDLSARHLAVAFAEHREVIPELLSLLAAAGQRVPAQWLPKLLRWGQQTAKLRPQVRAVLGQRGRWLAHQNPAWAYGRGQLSDEFSDEFLPESPDAQGIWQAGSRPERALFLRRWREVDPNAAREALAATWPSELVKDREALMAGLTHHLSMADEPFLENALDDRAQGVRKIAVELLAQLPESRLCQRMAQRVRPYVQLQQTGKGVKIKVTLPTRCEQDWIRDGLNPKDFEGAGKRARGLSQMLAGVPMRVWSGSPAAIVQGMADHKWQNLLLEGWGLAAARQKHVGWADALIAQWGQQLSVQGCFADLLALFSPDQQEQLLQKILPDPSAPNPLALNPSAPKQLAPNPSASKQIASKQPEDEALLAWFGQVTQSSRSRQMNPFSLEFSRLVWGQLIKLIKIRKKNSYTLSGPIKEIALILHPALTPEVAKAVAELSQDKTVAYLQNALNELVNRLSFRYEIHQVFSDSG